MEYLNRTSKVRLLRVNTGRVHSGSRKPRLEVQGCGSIWPQVSVCSHRSKVQWCWKAGQSIHASQGNRPDYQSLPATHQGFYPGMSLTFGATFFFVLRWLSPCCAWEIVSSHPGLCPLGAKSNCTTSGGDQPCLRTAPCPMGKPPRAVNVGNEASNGLESIRSNSCRESRG